LIDRVRLEHGPEFDANLPAAEVAIRARDGRELRRRIGPEELKGSPSNPMTDEDLRNKFLLCAEKLLNEREVDRILNACLGMEHTDRFANVLPLLSLGLNR